jgi:hypothetical protein
MDSGDLTDFFSSNSQHFTEQQPSNFSQIKWQVMTKDDIVNRSNLYSSTLEEKRLKLQSI